MNGYWCSLPETRRVEYRQATARGRRCKKSSYGLKSRYQSMKHFQLFRPNYSLIQPVDANFYALSPSVTNDVSWLPCRWNREPYILFSGCIIYCSTATSFFLFCLVYTRCWFPFLHAKLPVQAVLLRCRIFAAQYSGFAAIPLAGFPAVCYGAAVGLYSPAGQAACLCLCNSLLPKVWEYHILLKD